MTLLRPGACPGTMIPTTVPTSRTLCASTRKRDERSAGSKQIRIERTPASVGPPEPFSWIRRRRPGPHWRRPLSLWKTAACSRTQSLSWRASRSNSPRSLQMGCRMSGPSILRGSPWYEAGDSERLKGSQVNLPGAVTSQPLDLGRRSSSPAIGGEKLRVRSVDLWDASL